MALRFLGEESQSVPRDRVLASLRLLLEEPKLADLVIADLARWQDWSAIDRLVELFEKAEADNIFVREPIVNYLRACPLPQAAVALARLEKIDPEAVRRAATLAAFAGPLAGKPAADAGGTAAAGKDAAGKMPGDPDAEAGDPAMARPLPAEGAGQGVPPITPVIPGPATAAETAIAARIPAVIADEEATDDVPGIDPAQPASTPAAGQPPQATDAPAGGPVDRRIWGGWTWAVWAAIALFVAWAARSLFGPGGGDAPVR